MDDPRIPALVKKWREADPKAWAPFLAQAGVSWKQSARERGEGWASQTNDAQMQRMAELQAEATNACRVVLSRNKAVCPCYVQLSHIAKYSGSDPLLADALKQCPQNFSLHVETVYNLFPRWGGSHEQMRGAVAAARALGLNARLLRDLEAYVAIDEGTLLEVNEQWDAAARIFDGEIAKSPTARLLQERAEIDRRRKDPLKTLQHANAALELANGGWLFSADRLTRLLMDRAWALNAVVRKDDARTDVALAAEISPSDDQVKEWATYLRVPMPR